MEPLPIDEIRRTGVLWAINREVFHPRGFSLGLHPDGTWVLQGDGTEVWQFAGDVDDECFADFTKFLDFARTVNAPPKKKTWWRRLLRK